LAEATAAFEHAKSLEPYQATIACWLALALARSGTIDRANAESDRGWELDSMAAVVQNFTALTAVETGRIDLARRIAAWVPRNTFNAGTFGWILGAADSLEYARSVVAEIDARGGMGWLDQLNLSMATLAIGDTARALDALEKGFDRQEPIASWGPLWLRMYDPIRSTARFRALVRRIGLDEATLLAARRSSP